MDAAQAAQGHMGEDLGTDLLVGLPETDGQVEGGEGHAKPTRAGPLARQMWNSARRGNRSEEVWARFSKRVMRTSTLINAGDVALMFFAFARIKYKDIKALDALSPFILRHIEDFSTTELVLLLNAHKKLEYERLDSVRLLLESICARSGEWTGRHLALSANAVAYFYIYQHKFWRLVDKACHTLLWTMNPLELSNLVSALARIDRREPLTLRRIARMCRRCASRNLFSQETLATSMNAFAKLDFNHPKLAKVFEDAAVVKLDCALSLGPDYRKSSLRDMDVFDVQALVLVLHTLACLVGTSDEILEKLLTLVAWSSNEVGNYQRRLLKLTMIVLRGQHRDLWRRLKPEVKEAFYLFQKVPVAVTTNESRWMVEVRYTLKKMNIQCELSSVVDDQVLDVLLPTSKAVVYAVGPYGFYADSSRRTAYSKLHERLLEMEGYKCMVVPYYEWAELKTEEDKMVYLWSLGRRAAARNRGQPDAAAAPADLAEEFQSDLQSDLSEMSA